MALYDNNGGKGHAVGGHGHVGRDGHDGPGPGTSGSMVHEGPESKEEKKDKMGDKKGKAETQY